MGEQSLPIESQFSGGVIAIDGPAASGKSSTARAVADALGFAHLDSGSLYRGITLVGLRELARQGIRGGDPARDLPPELLLRAAEDRGLMLQPDEAGFAAYLEGEPVDDALRSAEITSRVSAISAIPVVREWINGRLRAMVRAGQNVVVDGRDIGTVVFPDADLKIFLTASPEARAGRRLSQRGDVVQPEGLDAEAAALAARDHADSTRAVAPLRPADDAVHLDTTTMDFPEQVKFIVERARPIFRRR
jgi:cytidylate kinase